MFILESQKTSCYCTIKSALKSWRVCLLHRGVGQI